MLLPPAPYGDQSGGQALSLSLPRKTHLAFYTVEIRSPFAVPGPCRSVRTKPRESRTAPAAPHLDPSLNYDPRKPELCRASCSALQLLLIKEKGKLFFPFFARCSGMYRFITANQHSVNTRDFHSNSINTMLM